MNIQESVQSLRLCVLIPTYNNDKTLEKVILSALEYCPTVIVVNDGSTDNTVNILTSFQQNIIFISYDKNKGKGYALKKGFEATRKRGYHYVLTLDADGQHFAEDIPVFINKIQSTSDSLIIGSRDFNQKNINQGSLFANKFSNFWVRLQTGYKLPDTQSGYRVYPVKKMKKMLPFCRRYEAEIELLVRCAWRGIRLESVPIQVYYPKKEDRVSHFRPHQDFLRISLLNTLLCIISIVYGYPSLLIHRLNKRK